MNIATITNTIFSSLTIIGQIIIIGLLLFLIIRKKAGNVLIRFFSNNALLFAFIVALISTGGSLLYSEIIGFAPCKLCWFQRIFMYPQVILLGMAFLKKDASIAIYSAVLSAIGGIIAAYHYLLQIGFAQPLSCSSVGYSASCSQKFILQFGYISIPMMALTAFLLILSLILIKIFRD